MGYKYFAIYDGSDRLPPRPKLNTPRLDAVGPPNPVKLEQHVRNAWDIAIGGLRRNAKRPAESAALPDQLEKEIPR